MGRRSASSPRRRRPVGATAIAGGWGAVALAILAAAAASLARPGDARAQAPTPFERDAPTLAIRAERSKVLLGEPFRVVVTAIHGPGTSVTLPAALPLGPFEETGRTESDSPLPGGLTRRSIELTVVGFQVGGLTLPPVPVTWVAGAEGGQAFTESLAIEVLSVIGDGREELKPTAPPVAIVERDLTLLWATGIALAATLALAAAWRLGARALRRRRGPSRAPAAPLALSADEEALARLRALTRPELLDGDDRRPLFFAAAEILRHYLGRTFVFDALEMTTRELLERLDRLTPEAWPRAELADWLEVCDLVKYARVPASREEAVRAIERAIALVERVRRSGPAPAAVAPAAVAPAAVAPAEVDGADRADGRRPDGH